jgi:hypothetical protein
MSPHLFGLSACNVVDNSSGRMDYFGPVVNLSARISDTAHGGQVVCSEDVQKVIVETMGLNGTVYTVCAVGFIFIPLFEFHACFR